MNKSSKTLQIFMAACTLGNITGLIPLAHGEEVTIQGQVTIVGGNCGIVAKSGNPINYGPLADGEFSDDHEVAFTNNGNLPGDVYIRGTMWVDSSTQNPVMGVGNTKYGPSGTAWEAKTHLTDTNSFIETVADQGKAFQTFQLKVNLGDQDMQELQFKRSLFLLFPK